MPKVTAVPAAGIVPLGAYSGRSHTAQSALLSPAPKHRRSYLHVADSPAGVFRHLPGGGAARAPHLFTVFRCRQDSAYPTGPGTPGRPAHRGLSPRAPIPFWRQKRRVAGQLLFIAAISISPAYRFSPGSQAPRRLSNSKKGPPSVGGPLL